MTANSIDEVYGFLIENYNDKSELEYRVKLSSPVIKSILEDMIDKWSSKCEIDQTVNMIYKKGKESFIKRFTFSSIEKNVVDSYKKNMQFSADLGNIKLTMSEETPEPIQGNLSMIRIKNRLSITEDIYRFDFTQIVKITKTEYETNKQAIRNNRVKLFGGMIELKGRDLYTAFISNSSDAYSYELEIEFLSKPDINKIRLENVLNKVPLLGATIASAGIISDLGKKLGGNTIKQILSKAVSLSQSEYNKIYPPIGMYVTYKADGERALVYIKEQSYIITAKYSKESNVTCNVPCILDCELVGDNILVFDAIEIDGQDVYKQSLSDRLAAINKLEFQGKVVIKKFFPITDDLAGSFRAVTDYKFKYPDDGFIMSSDDIYTKTKHYKIKPHNTIDFLAIKLPDNLKKDPEFPIKQGHSLYILFCGIRGDMLTNLAISRLKGYNNFFPIKTDIPTYMRSNAGYTAIQFSPSDNPKAYLWYVPDAMDKKLQQELGKSVYPERRNWVIVELESVDGKWIYHKVRNDRIDEPNYYGNDFKVAETNWMISQNPLNIKTMHKPPESYFGQGKDDIYWAQTAALSYGKTQLIEEGAKVSPNKKMLDLTCGKGQDLPRCIAAGFTEGVFIDIDKVAIATLIDRRYGLSKLNRPFKTHVAVMDLNDDANKNIAKLQDLLVKKPGFIYCNLGLHYLINDLNHLQNIAKFISACSATGTYFMYISFNGQKIVDLLKGKPEWMTTEGEVVKYHIRRKYTGDTLVGFGQDIEVKLPFGEYYTESLVDHNKVRDIFDKFGFKWIKSGSMDKFIDELVNDGNNKIGKKLTKDDIHYVGLYEFHMFKR